MSMKGEQADTAQAGEGQAQDALVEAPVKSWERNICLLVLESGSPHCFEAVHYCTLVTYAPLNPS